MADTEKTKIDKIKENGHTIGVMYDNDCRYCNIPVSELHVIVCPNKRKGYSSDSTNK